jgi:hypothetical protein
MASGTVQGTTNAGGTVTFTVGNLRGSGSVTLSVDSVTHTVLTYDSGANHDGDGDSDGTSITVSY